MKTPEARVKDEVRKHLKGYGAYQFSPVQMGIGSPTLDILCCLKGRFIGIEVKAAGKKPTQRQLLTMEAIRQSGGYAIWGDNLATISEQIVQIYARHYNNG